jgi:hypothetical protein
MAYSQSTKDPYDPRDPETYLRLGCKVLIVVQVQGLQPYKDWVKNGGLERFAAAHNVKPDFVNHFAEYPDKPGLVFKFYDELATIPGLEDVVAPPPRTQPSFTSAAVQQFIHEMECGFGSEDNDEEEAAEQVEEQLQGGKKESGTAPAFDQDKDMSRKT